MEFTIPLCESDNISYQKPRIREILKTVGYFTYCKDIDGLMDAVCMRHSPEQWRLFFDASKKSLKEFLLHNGNKLPSIPVVYAPSTKEMYTTMNNILVKVDYKKYQWEVHGDFKVIAVLLGLQPGYTKYSCFSCVSGIATPAGDPILGNIGTTDTH